MTYRALLIALMAGSATLPAACSGKSTTSDETGGGGGTAGKAGASGRSGGGGSAGSSGAGTAGGMTTGTGGTGTAFGGGSPMGVGGRGFGFGGAFTSGRGGTDETGGEPGDLGVAERLPFCRTVCAYGPVPAAQLVAGDAGASGASEAAGGAPAAGGAENGGAPAAGGVSESGGEGGAGEVMGCGHVDACVANLCPTQSTEYCGERLTAYVGCMANADPKLVASLVTSCTEDLGPALDTLIYQACYGQYADWTRSCL
ncbi:MAG TPA: hypothetical protein VMI54_28100 [Polyangiaceae bacterium]|nr:hypothetical protein [Polyangiaceae bacterium]